MYNIAWCMTGVVQTSFSYTLHDYVSVDGCSHSLVCMLGPRTSIDEAVSIVLGLHCPCTNIKLIMSRSMNQNC